MPDRAELNIVLNDQSPAGGTGTGTGGASGLGDEIAKLRELLDKKLGGQGTSGGGGAGESSGIASLFTDLGNVAQTAGFPNLGAISHQVGKLFGGRGKTQPQKEPVVKTRPMTDSEAAAEFEFDANTGQVSGMPEVEAAGELPGATPAGGGAAGGTGMLGAAAGIAAGLLVAEAACRVMAGTMNMATDGIRAAGDAAVSLAGNDGLGAVLGVTESVISGLEQIPIAGQVWAAELRLATAPVIAFRDVIQAFVDRGRELSVYSGELMGATTMADVQSMMDDIKEANEMGPELAKLTDAQSRAWHELREILLPIRKAIVEQLIPIMEGTADAIRDYKTDYKDHIAIMLTTLDVLNGLLSGMTFGVTDMSKAIEAIRKMIQGKLQQEENIDANKVIQEQLDDLMKKQVGGLAGVLNDPVKAAGQQQLNVPLFNL